MAETVSCPACEANFPPGSRFCPACGVALAESGTAEMFARRPSSETRELLKRQVAAPRRTIHEAYRRPLGAQPPAFLGALSVVALILGVILLITGPLISAIIALCVFVGLTGLFIPAVRHDPHSQAARITRRGVNSAMSIARFVAVAGRAWAHAAVSLMRIKQRRLRVKRELHSQLTPLGDAVHRGDRARAQQLKGQADQLEQQLKEINRDASAVVTGAREVVDRERARSQATQTMPAIETEVELGEAEEQPAPNAQLLAGLPGVGGRRAPKRRRSTASRGVANDPASRRQPASGAPAERPPS